MMTNFLDYSTEIRYRGVRVGPTKLEDDEECQLLCKFFSKAPQTVALHIISFAVNPLHKVALFEEFLIRRYRFSYWEEIGTKFELASRSTVGEFTYQSELGRNRQQKFTAHESVTKKKVEQFYRALLCKALATRKAPQE